MLAGVGLQLVIMIMISLLFVAIGFVKDTYRGNMITMGIFLYVFSGSFAGYLSARIYKMMNGPYWLRLTLVTATFYPGIGMIVFFLINLLLLLENSSGTVNIKYFIELLALWLGISSPLVFLGSFLGFKRQ